MGVTCTSAPPTARHYATPAGQLGWHIDTCAVGGYVVAPGSVLPTGRCELASRDRVVELPDWLLSALHPPPPLPPPPAGTALQGAGVRHAGACVAAIVQAECWEVAAAVVGQRHRTLLHAARQLGRLVGSGALDIHVAHAALTAAAQGYVGIEGYTRRQVERDIADGLAFGARRPRHIDSPTTSRGRARLGTRQERPQASPTRSRQLPGQAASGVSTGRAPRRHPKPGAATLPGTVPARE
ncbi:bifunctional DNA primase/polymerase [Pseudonocardia lacus]|uniref:bifunctional DNA primase/polymerase n=1 Tax=Pseudonocardia lacus TaxID=2835865 RepID=UPI0020287198|nr:bifunctional DNA primase/polymerase [Pseudonocardia lacus]